MTRLATLTLFTLLSIASACGQTSTDPGHVGGALPKVTPPAKPRATTAQPLPIKSPAVTPTPAIPVDLDRAFDVEESKPIDNLEKTSGEEDEPIQGMPQGEPSAGALPGGSPGARPVNPTVKPYSPPPTGL